MSSRFFFLQGKAPKEIHAILTEILACFVPGRVKNLSVPMYTSSPLHVLNTFCPTGVPYTDSVCRRPLLHYRITV